MEFKSNPSNSGTRNNKGDLDCTFYSLDKWFGLLDNNNPNQIELLFVNNINILYSTKYLQNVLDNKNIFISKKCKHSFAGYAYSQMERNKLKSGNQTGRKELIAKFGFDPKLCSHAIRLATQCLRLLVEGKLVFPLSNNQELIDIKNGLWPYEKVLEKFKLYEPLLEKAYIESKLQYAPNLEAIDKLQYQTYKDYYHV